MEQYFSHNKREILHMDSVSNTLPIKKYKIDFGGNVKTDIKVINNEITITGAMNGWGDGISESDIIITEL